MSGDSAGERCDPAGHPQGVPLRSSGNWSDRAAGNRFSRGRLEVAPPGKEHGARKTRPSQSARETRRSKRRPEGRRSQSAPRTTPLLPGVRHRKFQRKRRRGDRKVPPPNPARTGRGLSVGGARRVAAVERLVGATLVVALPRTAPPSAGHCLGTTGPGGWSGDFLVADWDRRPERRLSGADWDRRPSGRREWRRGAATPPGNDATPQGTHKGCPYGHRELEGDSPDNTVCPVLARGRAPGSSANSTGLRWARRRVRRRTTWCGLRRRAGHPCGSACPRCAAIVSNR